MIADPVDQVDDASAARSALYSAIADAIEFPSAEFHEQIALGVFAERMRDIVAALPYALSAPPDFDGLRDAGEYVDLQADYIRIFDVGAMRPPCPLYGGEWLGARKHSLEETLRFYRYFGLKVDESAKELPDHITVELEFLQVMAYMDGAARASGGDSSSLLRAERDFIERQPGRWWPRLRQKLAGCDPPPFYAALVALIDDALAADHAYIKAQLAAS